MSVAPSVLFSVAMITVLVLIVASLTYYYTSLFSVPQVLPTYGSVFVETVDPSDGTAVIVNRYGYPIQALFVVKLLDIPNYPTNLSKPDSFSFWLVIRPGKNKVCLLCEARIRFGSNVSADHIDMGNSYFVIGNMKYYVREGSGVIPQEPVSRPLKKYVVSGLGLSSFSGFRGFLTLYFNETLVAFNVFSSATLGYLRSITNYWNTTVTTERHFGTCCNSTTVCRYGALRYCDSSGCTCLSCQKCVLHEYSVNCLSSSNQSFTCARDNVYTYFWTPNIESSAYVYLSSPALAGFNWFETGVPLVSTDAQLPITSYTSRPWPYALPTSSCWYTYREYTHTTSTRTKYDYACDEICGYLFSYGGCSETVTKTLEESRWGCPSGICVGLSEYLYGRLSDGKVILTSYMNAGTRVGFKVNITLTYAYYRTADPEASDSFVRLTQNHLVRIVLPRIVGYVSIPYTEDLVEMKITINSSVSNLQVKVKTSSGYTSSPSLYPELSSWSGTAFLVPLGYIPIHQENTEGSKTFYFYTTTQPVIEVAITSPQGGITVPMQSSDAVTINIVFDLFLTPSSEIITTPS